MITIKETTKNEISNVKELWADGDVMKFVGFPDGFHETDENMEEYIYGKKNIIIISFLLSMV